MVYADTHLAVSEISNLSMDITKFGPMEKEIINIIYLGGNESSKIEERKGENREYKE